MPGSIMISCDVTKDEELEAAFSHIRDAWGTFDGLVHSLAFANSEDLDGLFVNTSRAGFALAHDISAYSLVAICRYAQDLLNEGSSIITMTYIGGERVVSNYNVMGVAKAALDHSVRYLASDLGPKGIRVNAISAGPINTLAARGIKGFTGILSEVASKAPLRKNITQEDVANTAMFLASHLAGGITGEVIHVDAGYSIIGF